MKIRVTIEVVLDSADWTVQPLTKESATNYIIRCMDGGADWPELWAVTATTIRTKRD